jgi:hypothetical protein
MFVITAMAPLASLLLAIVLTSTAIRRGVYTN